jgi:ribosomal protein S27AE
MSLKPKEKQKPEFIALNIGTSKKLFCNQCGLELLSDHSCGKCGVFYRPEDARHAVQIRGLDGREPGPQTQTIPIAFIDSTPKKQQDMGGTFKALKDSGAKITSYSESNV